MKNWRLIGQKSTTGFDGSGNSGALFCSRYLQGRGHSVPCSVRMAFQQSPCTRKEGRSHKIWAVTQMWAVMLRGTARKHLMSLPRDRTLHLHWPDGISSFEICSAGGSRGKFCSSACVCAWAIAELLLSTFPICSRVAAFPLLHQGMLFFCDCCIYFTSCARNVVWHSLGCSRLWFTGVINIPKYTCKLNDTLIL